MIFPFLGCFVVLSILKSTSSEMQITECETSEECEQILTDADIENESIKANCGPSPFNEEGVCLIGYFKAITVNYNASMKDPPGPYCTKVKNDQSSLLPAKCRFGGIRLRNEFPKFTLRQGLSYICKTGNKKVSYEVCTGELIETELAQKQAGGEIHVPTKSKSGCVSVKECGHILNKTENRKPGIFKTCFDIDKECTTVCDRACGFSYSKASHYNETARNPNPNICKIPMGMEKTIVKKACVERYLEILNVLIPKQKVESFKEPGFICTSLIRKHSIEVVSISNRVSTMSLER